jgi:glycosyltransferase involved in cell wall biosynthesis
MLDQVRQLAGQFDILHFHIDPLHFPLFRPLAGRTLTTLHGRQDLADLRALYAGFSDMRLVTISEAQRRDIAQANVAGTIYHGLPLELFEPNYNPRGNYLAFLGRISQEKRPDRAIELARRANIPLKIAAKTDSADVNYFHDVVEPLLDGPGVEFIGEIKESDKCDFLGNARALLFPIDWPEPFGLVMIEAMACGAPVLAFDCGSVREIIEDGVTGRIVSTMDEAVEALPEVLALDRRRVRRRCEERFSARRMARDYLGIYRSMLAQSVLSERERLPGLRVQPDAGSPPIRSTRSNELASEKLH